MAIHLLDLKSRNVSELKGSRGLWRPRWSPDGRYIAAATADQRALAVRTAEETQWTELIRMRAVDCTAWARDSHSIYFSGSDNSGHRAIYNVAIRTGKLTEVADLDDFSIAPEAWFGVDPGGAPLALRGVSVEEVFKLKCQLP